MQQELCCTGRQVCCLPLDMIVPQRQAEETDQDARTLRRLAASIRREGLLEPLVVEENGKGGYRLLDGEKRYRACRLIGMTHAEVLIQPGQYARTPGDMIDALMRGSLHYMDQARMMHRLENEFGVRSGMIAGMLGLSPEQAAQKLTLLSMEHPLQEFLRQSDLPEAVAYQLMRLPPGEMRLQLAQQAQAGQLGVRDVDLLVRSMLLRTPQTGRAISLVRDYRLYANAIRSMTDQIRENGIAASYDEQREGTTLVITVRLPIRRQRRGQRNEQQLHAQ